MNLFQLFLFWPVTGKGWACFVSVASNNLKNNPSIMMEECIAETNMPMTNIALGKD